MLSEWSALLCLRLAGAALFHAAINPCRRAFRANDQVDAQGITRVYTLLRPPPLRAEYLAHPLRFGFLCARRHRGPSFLRAGLSGHWPSRPAFPHSAGGHCGPPQGDDPRFVLRHSAAVFAARTSRQWPCDHSRWAPRPWLGDASSPGGPITQVCNTAAPQRAQVGCHTARCTV